MGKFALILVASVAAIAVLHGAASGDGLRESARQAGEHQRLALSRTAAKTGWARAKHALVAEFKSGTVSGSNGTSSYQVTTVVDGQEAVVTSVGSTPVPGRSATTDYRIAYRLQQVGGDDLPEFAEQAVVVDGDLTVSGNGSIVSPGLADKVVPVRVHANGTLHSGSKSTVVEGFGTYTTSVSGKIHDTFQPASNPDGDPVLSQRDSIHVPSVVPSEILAAHGGADVNYPAGSFYAVQLQDVVLPGGTRDDPMVYHVKGGALLVNVVFDGYAIFVAEGEVKLQGTVRGTPDAGREESALAVFTTGEVSMSGGSAAHAAIHANGGLRYKGNVDVYGNLMVAGDLNNGGGASIHHLPPSPGLFKTWAEGDPGLLLLAYREQ